MTNAAWLDYGRATKLADAPELHGQPVRLADLRPTHPAMPYARWLASLPREAWMRQADLDESQRQRQRDIAAVESARDAKRPKRRSA